MHNLMKNCNIPKNTKIISLTTELKLRKARNLEIYNDFIEQNEKSDTIMQELGIVKKELELIDEVLEKAYRMIRKIPMEYDVSYIDYITPEYIKAMPMPPIHEIVATYDREYKKAILGDSTVQYRLGIMHLTGKDTFKDASIGKAFFVKAAEQGHVDSMRMLGDLYLEGIHIPKIKSVAILWYEKASEKGDRHSIQALMDIYKEYEYAYTAELIKICFSAINYNVNEKLAKSLIIRAYCKSDRIEEDKRLHDWCLAVINSNTDDVTIRQDAAYLLGRMYQNGLNVTMDKSVAHSWYMKSYEMGNINAAYHLAKGYEDGDGINKDIHLAIKYYEEIIGLNSKRKDIALIHKLVNLYLDGSVNEITGQKVVQHLNMAIKLGDATAANKLGYLYETGNFIKKNRDKAIICYEIAARNNIDAQYRLGCLYLDGSETIELGIDWLKKAAVNGSTSAQLDIAKRYFKSYFSHSSNDQSDWKQMISWLKTGELSDVETQYYLALISLKEDSIDNAIMYLEKCAEGGFEVAKKMLADMYYEGMKVPQDFAKAFHYYSELMNDYDPMVYINIGKLYLNGDGGAKDSEKALSLFQQVANSKEVEESEVDTYISHAKECIGMYYEEMKHYDKAKEIYEELVISGRPSANFRLGQLYEYGRGLYKDLEEAYDWYKKGADLLDVDSTKRIGYFYEQGFAVIKNSKRARIWYEKAVKLGDIRAYIGIAESFLDDAHNMDDMREAIVRYGVVKDILDAASICRFGEIYEMVKKIDLLHEAQKKYLIAANKKDAKAQYNLAMTYQKRNVGDSDNETIQLLIESAEQNYEKAIIEIIKLYNEKDEYKHRIELKENYILHCNLGIAYDEGKLVTQDYEKAFYWISKAAEQKYPRAINSLGVCYMEGLGVEKNLEKAYHLFTEAAELGNEGAYANLGRLYYNGEYVDENKDLAFTYYEKAAKLNSQHGKYMLGLCYLNGYGTTIDKEQAVYYLIQASEEGHEKAHSKLGEYYNELKDYYQAGEYYRRSAESGNAEDQFNLGRLFYNGEGFRKNLKEAYNWFNKSADQGDKDSQYALYTMYDTGKGVSKSEANAFYWLKKAAGNKNNKAMLKLGEYYLNHTDNSNGKGTPINHQEALKWYESEELSDDNHAKCQLGYLYTLGDGIEKNYDKAFQLLSGVTKIKSSKAFLALAYLYDKGYGVSKDIKKAYEYYKKAAQLGSEEADKILSSLRFKVIKVLDR